MAAHRIIRMPLPAGLERVPAEALQFEDDWPGFFMRGDEAIVPSARIQLLAERLVELMGLDIISLIFSLRKLGEIIDRHVRVRPEKPARQTAGV